MRKSRTTFRVVLDKLAMSASRRMGSVFSFHAGRESFSPTSSVNPSERGGVNNDMKKRMKVSDVETLLHSHVLLYVQRPDGLVVSNGTWTIYDDRTAEVILAHVTPPDFIVQSHRSSSMVFQRGKGSRWTLTRSRGPNLVEYLRRFEEAVEAGKVLDLVDTGLIVRDRFGQNDCRDIVVLHDRQTLRFVDRKVYDVLIELFPGSGLAAEKQWHIGQRSPIVFHDYGDVLATVESVVYTGDAVRHIYPVA